VHRVAEGVPPPRDPVREARHPLSGDRQARHDPAMTENPGAVRQSLVEARWLLDQYRNYYNHHRKYNSLGYRTPNEYASSLDESGSAKVP